MELQKIIRNCYKQLYANKLDNPEEIDKFFYTCNLPRLNQREIKNLNRIITSQDTELIIKNLSKKKSTEPDSFTGEFYQTFKEKLIIIPLKFFQ